MSGLFSGNTAPNRNVREVEADVRSGEYPRGLKIAVPVWVLYALLLIVVGISLGGGSGGEEEETADALRGTLGGENVAYPDQPAGWIIAFIALGVAVVSVAVFLALGRAWARPLIVAVGVGGVIAMAAASAWQAVIAMPLLFLAALPLMSPAVHRYMVGTGESRSA